MDIVGDLLGLAADAAPFIPAAAPLAAALKALSIAEPIATPVFGAAFHELETVLATPHGKIAVQQLTHIFGSVASKDPSTGALTLAPPSAPPDGDKNDPSASTFYGN